MDDAVCAIRPGTDVVRHARLLARTHDALLSGGRPPVDPRRLVERAQDALRGAGGNPAAMTSEQRNAEIASLLTTRLTDRRDFTREERDRLNALVSAEYGIPPEEAQRRLQAAEAQANQTLQQAEQRARELLERVGLADQATSYPDRLSGGQQQRTAIARAIASRPRLLLLDEVTSALDPELVGEVLALVRELKDDGMTIVMATHEMGFAREAADRVCFLDAGRILEQGAPAQVLGDPQQGRTRQFLSRVLGPSRAEQARA